MTLLRQKMGNVKAKLKNHKKKLNQKEYFLLVAGETGSGKSSLINLILGEELLPYALLSTTSTICEVRYGSERRIVAHFKDKDPETGLPTKTFPLVENPAGSTEQSYLDQISTYVHVKSDREKGSIYKKIELFLPHRLLENDVVIIDSPGVGESEIMDDIVLRYLPQAFAFIYVINSANSGGVQKDRLGKLLEEVVRIREGVGLETHDEFPPKSALFVCNKWDQVPEKEIKDVQDDVVTKLKKCWPGLDPELQIVFLSTKNASIAQNYGFVTDEFLLLMSGMRSMILKTIEARLEIHWKWLDELLSRIIHQAKAFVTNASTADHKEVQKKMDAIVSRLKVIEEQQNEVMEDLRNHLKQHADDAVKKLSEYLRSEKVKARFTSWTLDEVPEAETSWEVTESNIIKKLRSRLQDIIEHWEEDNQVFGHARESLLQYFQQQYNFVEGQLRNLQGAVTADDLVPSTGFDFTMKRKVVIGVTSPIWVPLSLVALVIGAPVVGIMAIKRKLEYKTKIRSYQEDKCTFMMETSAKYLKDVTSEAVLKPFVESQLKDAKMCLKQIKARIPELIQGDRMLCQQLRNETRSKEEIQRLYQPIQNKASEIRGRLAEFGLKRVRAVDISGEELDWKEDMSFCLGSGAFSIVYLGKLKRQGNEQTVALKVSKEALDARTASLAVNEIELLRKLQHPYIVKFHGMSLINKHDITRVILVMEKCKESLKSHIFNNPNTVPARSMGPAVEIKACRWAQEITTALAFIHEQGVIHRDLKLENILLSEKNSAKITDVGYSKVAQDITGTLAGTPLYMAPEVFHSNAIYDSKADIYSLGIVLWEIWYGKRAFSEVNSPTSEAFYNDWVDKGYRPKYVEGCREPPRRWKAMMEICWKTNPDERLSAAQCNEKTTALYLEVTRQDKK